MWRDEMDRIRCLTISSRSNTLYAYAFSTIQCVRGVVTIARRPRRRRRRKVVERELRQRLNGMRLTIYDAAGCCFDLV